MKLLILGGTADGRVMAEELHACLRRGELQQGLEQENEAGYIVYSVAGLVRVPQVPCEVISGGFTQYGGLGHYICNNSINAILDMTHPYAQRMSQRAHEAAAATGIAYWRFHRLAWEAGEGDNWHECQDWPQLLAQLEDKASILFTAGQLDSDVLNELVLMSEKSAKSYVLRTAVAPGHPLPVNMQWIKAIGPFSERGETALMRQFGIDALVSKNSGGDSTSAKLTVARRLCIPVYMLSRPEPVSADRVFSNFDQCREFVIEYLKGTQGTQIASTAGQSVADFDKRGTA